MNACDITSFKGQDTSLSSQLRRVNGRKTVYKDFVASMCGDYVASCFAFFSVFRAGCG